MRIVCKTLYATQIVTFAVSLPYKTSRIVIECQIYPLRLSKPLRAIGQIDLKYHCACSSAAVATDRHHYGFKLRQKFSQTKDTEHF